MSERSKDIEALARKAARLAGRDPDEHLTLTLADAVVFDGQLWRYPDFLTRAETAYEALRGARLVLPEELNGHAGAMPGADGTLAAKSGRSGTALGSK